MWPGLLMIGAVAAAVVVGIGLATSRSPQAPGVTSHGEDIKDVRTLIVSSEDDGTISEPGQPLHGILHHGDMPRAEMMATVLSDEDCTPDAAGVSHCTNRLRMADGSELAVTHPHRMADVPCLSPGERVLVRSA